MYKNCLTNICNLLLLGFQDVSAAVLTIFKLFMAVDLALLY